MPSWKKLIVSGSDAALNSLTVSTSVTANSFVKLGGTSPQFLKADGSVDSTVYQPLLTNPVTGTGVSGQVAYWNGTTTVTGNSNFTYSNNTLFVSSPNPADPTIITTGYGITGAVVNRRANGTPASPTTVNTNDFIGGVIARGYNGSAFTAVSNGGVYIYASETWNSTANGTYIGFETTQTGGTVRTEKVRIDPSGNVGVGTTTPSTKLDVIGSITAKPLTSGSIMLATPDSQNGLVIYANTATQERFDIRRYSTRVSFLAHGVGTAPGEPSGFFLFNTGNLAVGIATDSGDKFRVSGGTVRFDSVTNATGDFVTIDANNVLRKRTATETRTDIGAIGGTIASGQVAFGTGSGTIGGDANMTYTTGRLTINRSSDSRIALQDNGTTTLLLQALSTAGRISGNSTSVIPIEFWTSGVLRWTLLGTGVIESSGAQTIRSSTGNFTIATAGGNGNILLTPNGTGLVMIGSGTPTNLLDVNGTARIRTINNLGVSATNVLVPDATGVVSLRTATQFLSDAGGISGTIASGQVAFGTGVNTVGGDSGLTWNNSTKVFTTIGQQIFQGSTASDTAPLGTELATTGSGTNWTGTSFATGYTHVVGSTDALTTSIAAVNGTYYQIAYTITGRTAGSITINYGGTSTAGITATGATGPVATSTANLEIVPTTDFDGTVVLSIRSIGTSSAITRFNDSNGVARIEIRATTAVSNTLIGNNAGRRITTGANNSFVGVNAGLNNTTGSSNSFFGVNAGLNNTTGSSNSFVGVNAGVNNTTGVNNSFFGRDAGFNNTTGVSNSFFGRDAGFNNTTGVSNSFFGVNAGLNNTTGVSNSFFGVSAGLNNTTGSSNSFVGVNAGFNNTTGVNNSFFGVNAGRFISSGANLTIANNSIFLGVDTRANADNETNQIVIGHNAIGGGSNTTTIGNSSTTSTRIPAGSLWVNTTSGTNTLDVNGTARIRTSAFISSDSGNTVIGGLVDSGLAKLQVNGNATITNALLSNQENLDVDSAAAEVVAQISSTTYTAVFFDYSIKNGTNVRSGTVYATHNGTNVVFVETSTADLGDTSGVELSVDLNGGNIRLLATVTSDNWVIKSLVRGL